MNTPRVPSFARARLEAAAAEAAALAELTTAESVGSAALAAPGPSDSMNAARNGAMLGGSLAFTASVGVLVSLLVVPNWVGAKDSGILGFGEALATVGLVFAGFGMDTYLRKEVAVQRSHIDRVLASVLALRLLVCAVLTAVAAALVIARHNSTDSTWHRTLSVVVLYCGAQFFQQTAETYAAMLQAVGKVAHQSRLTIWTKTGWAIGVIAGLMAGFGIWVVPAALLASEAAKAWVLGRSAQQEFDIEWKLRISEAVPFVRAGLPFLVTAISVKVISWLDVALVKLFTGDDSETGFYATGALRISAIALLLAPLVQWVVLPLASRAAATSREAFADVVAESFGWVLSFGVPLSVLLGLNADILLETALPDFTPSIRALRILSAMIALTYVSMLGATLLIADGKSWRVVRITFITIAIDALLNTVLIRHGWHHWGVGTQHRGGAGVGAATSLVSAELVGSTLMALEVRRAAGKITDAAARRSIASMIVACLAVAAFDRLIREVGIARPILDTAAMFVALVGVGVIKREWISLVLRKVSTRVGRR